MQMFVSNCHYCGNLLSLNLSCIHSNLDKSPSARDLSTGSAIQETELQSAFLDSEGIIRSGPIFTELISISQSESSLQSPATPPLPFLE